LDEEIELPTKIDRIVWNGILPGLETNKDKWDRKVQANRENGKLGGAPMGNQNASKEKTTQINPEQPKQPDKREKTNDNSKMEIENREELIDNTKLENETDKTKNQTGVPYYAGSSSNNSNKDGWISMYEFNKQRGLPY